MKSILVPILLFVSFHFLKANDCSTAISVTPSSNWQSLSDDQFDGQQSWYVISPPFSGTLQICRAAGFTIYNDCLFGDPSGMLQTTVTSTYCSIGINALLEELQIAGDNSVYIKVQAGVAGSAIYVRFLTGDVVYCNAATCYENPELNSQQIVQCENFEAYQNGGIVQQADAFWQLFNGVAEDAAVETYPGYSEKYLRLVRGSNSDPDVVYRLGDRTSGRYRLSWGLYVFSGNSAYYNIQHKEQTSVNPNWAYHVYFAPNGSGSLRIGDQPGGQSEATFSYNNGDWNRVMQIIDLNDNTAELWINDHFVHSWTFSRGSIPLNQLGGINFYANNNNGAGNDYAIDDICLREIQGCGCPLIYAPVCVKNGEEYSNDCLARCYGGYISAEWNNGVCNPVVNNCNEAVPILCGQTFFNQTTIDQGNNFNSADYANCQNSGFSFNGPDKIYKINITQRQQVKVILDFDDADLDLFLLDECSDPQQLVANFATHCIAASYEDNHNNGVYKEAIDIILSPGTYYIIVDGKNSNDWGPFSLSISCDCSCSEPDNDRPAGRVALCDDFEAYDPGPIAAQSTRWRIWDDQYIDGLVIAQNDNQMLQIKDDGAPVPDVLYLLDGLNSGRYRISWRLFVESGRSAYYNIQHPVPGPATPANWAYQVYFNEDGSGLLDLLNEDISFTYYNGTWNNVMQIIDINQDVAELWVNSKFVASWNFSEGTQGSSLGLGAIDFFAYPNSSYLVDQLCVWETDGFYDCTSEDPSICGKNGRPYNCANHARYELYTSREWGACFSVCDYGGTFIYRGVDFSGSLGYSNLAPGELLSEPCILNAYDNEVPNPLFADIFVFFNDQDQDIRLNLDSGSSTAKGFLFSCICDGPCGQLCLGNFADLNQNPVSAPGAYYLVILNSVPDTYTFSISPRGYCAVNPPTISCGDTISGTVNGGDDNFSTETSDAYGNCYGGSRTYLGDDVEYQFTLDEPSRVFLTLDVDAPMGLFVYDFLCGSTCIDYAEVPAGGGTAVVDFDSLTLPEGIYYVVIDKENTFPGTADDFTLTMDCVPDVQAIYNFIQSDTGPPDICPVDSNSLHAVGILHDSYDGFSINDLIVFNAEDELGNSFVVSRQSYTSTGNSVNFQLPEDTLTDGLKCSYYEGDTLEMYIYDVVNNIGRLVSGTPEYASPGDLGADADSIFTTGASSVVIDFVERAFYNFSIPAPIEVFSPAGGDRYVLLTASPPFNWDILTIPGDTWVSLSRTNGAGTKLIEITVDSNPYPLSRSTVLEFRYPTNDLTLHRYLTVIQRGACLTPAVSISVSDTQPCEGQEVTLTANFDPMLEDIYALEWNTGETGPSITVTPGLGDNYTLTVTESNCSLASTLNSGLNVVPLPNAPSNPQDQSICQGDDLPALTVNALPGQEIRWYDNSEGTGTVLDTGPSFTPPGAGVYYAQTVDSNSGCVSSTTTPVSLTVQDTPLVDAGPDMTICLGGTAILSASASGGGSHLFEWNDGTAGPTLSVSPASDASFTVTVTDSNGCTASDVAQVVVNALPTPAPLVVSHALCGEATGEATVTVQGGATPYSFSWSNGATGPTVSNLPPGLYEVEVTDANQCSNTASVSIDDIEGPTVEAGPNASICNGETTTLTASATGGDGNYSFEWEGGASAQATFNVSPTTPTTYSVRVTDGNGCSSTDIVQVNVFENPIIETELEAEVCKGESLELTASASGGQGPDYSFDWNGGTGNEPSFTISPGENTTYTLLVTDGNGCIASAEVRVDVLENPSVMINAIDATCGEADGTAFAEADGGAGQYVYLWNNGSMDNIITGLAPGMYYVTVTDNNGCAGVGSVPINNVAGPEITTSQDQDICDGQSAEVFVTVQEGTGTPPFIYHWSNDADASSLVVSPQATTEYLVTVTDVNGCSAVGQVMVQVRQPPVADAGKNLALCLGEEATLTAVSGDGYNYNWSTGETSQSILVRPDTTTVYGLSVSKDGCEAVDSVEVTVHPAIEAGLEVKDSLSCHGDANGAVFATPSGGVPGYSFSWSTGSNLDTIFNLGSGTYQATITDQAGCQVVDSVELAEPESIAIFLLDIIPDTNHQMVGAIQITVSGGAPPYQFLWNGPDSLTSAEQNLSGLGEGLYQVGVTDANHCEITSQFFHLMVPADEQVLSAAVRLYPNPTGGSFYLKFDLPNPEAVEVRILDVLGKLLHWERHPQIQDEALELKLSAYPAGLYLARISIGGNTIVKKVTLQKQ